MMIFSTITRASLNLVPKRFIRKKINMKAWPNDWVPFVWNRPEKVPGYYDEADLVNMPDPNLEVVRPELMKSKELFRLNPDDPIRKVFSLSHAKRGQQNKALVKEYLQKLGLVHDVEYSMSYEAKIISLTFTLRHICESIKSKGADDNFNGFLRTIANGAKYRRLRYLYDLRELHVDRYNRLIKLLNLEPKENLFNVKYLRPFRKVQMRRLAIEYSRDLKEKKVEEFMQSLEKEKVDFEKYKEETLKWIEEKERILNAKDEVQTQVV